MEAINNTLLPIVSKINGYLSDYVLIILLLGAGVFFSFKTKFVQVRCFGEGMRRVFGNLTLNGGKQESGMSSFQALATAIAAQVGTGNIVGASGAIMTGGPGAIFWMWIIAFFGMSTIYSEAVLAQKTRVKTADGEILGGPVYYIRHAFKGGFGKFLAGFFSVAIILALGFTGCMVQANSIGSAFETAFHIPGWIVGIILVVICAFIFIGGTQRLAATTEKLVPIMAALFLLGGLVLIVMRIKFLPEAFGMIFKYAFTPQAVLGGTFGAAIKAALSQGVKRGLFSNEAGMGSTPHAHALANVKEPHEQGTVAMIGVFIDTLVVLTITALVVIITMYVDNGPLNEAGAGLNPGALGLSKTNLVQNAFGTVFGTNIGNAFVAICLFFFAFSTILSWNMFGKVNTEDLFHGNKKAVLGYSIISLIFIFMGTLTSSDLVWELSDMFNQLMVLPNVIGLFGCTALVVSLTKFTKSKDKLK